MISSRQYSAVILRRICKPRTANSSRPTLTIDLFYRRYESDCWFDKND